MGEIDLEAEAVLEILRRVQTGSWELIGSEAVDAELSIMPSAERLANTLALAQMCSTTVTAGAGERARAMELSALGFRYMDALHVACAETVRCDVLLTTDDGFLAKARPHKERIMVRVVNPLQWIAEVSASWN